MAWENEEMISVFYLPIYSPELNPDELLNADLKQRHQGRSGQKQTGPHPYYNQRPPQHPETARASGKLLRPERRRLCRINAFLPCRINKRS